MTTVDYVIAMARLRPGAEIAIIGQGNTYEDIGPWRDSKTQKPTKAECEAEWTRYLAEQAVVEQSRQKLEQSRRDLKGADLDMVTFNSQPALIQRLAQKIAWLEQEIADLRRSN
jgi:hypothetical protein